MAAPSSRPSGYDLGPPTRVATNPSATFAMSLQLEAAGDTLIGGLGHSQYRATPVYNNASENDPLVFPFCTKEFRRPQDRLRLQHSHFADHLCCPILDCTWTGYRKDTFSTHLTTSHSQQYQDVPCCAIYSIERMLRQYSKKAITLE
ncbi:hypothetical protein BC834DRAFT_468041 [Gloeopeniophorella convolvens]|nr:hypothetical protein BC834DRAFT_468041 [Gloeopeniophorella convolvens]